MEGCKEFVDKNESLILTVFHRCQDVFLRGNRPWSEKWSWLLFQMWNYASPACRLQSVESAITADRVHFDWIISILYTVHCTSQQALGNFPSHPVTLFSFKGMWWQDSEGVWELIFSIYLKFKKIPIGNFIEISMQA